jgi:hypothetical protein
MQPEPPTFGFWLRVTDDAKERVGLTAAQWVQVLAADGFAHPETTYRFGFRPAYADVTQHPDVQAVLEPGEYPNTVRMIGDWILGHSGLLLANEGPRIAAAVARAERHAAALRRHFA